MLLAAAAVPVASAAADVDGWEALGRGAVVLFRHATAPGVGDPPDFRLGDCATQRNLDRTGRAEAAAIGTAFRTHGVAVGAVLSSRWCRTHDTAALAFPGRVRDEPVFDSFFDDATRDAAQTAAARALLLRWKGPGSLVVVTHQVNITALTGIVPASGEGVVVVADGDRLRVVGRIAPGTDAAVGRRFPGADEPVANDDATRGADDRPDVRRPEVRAAPPAAADRPPPGVGGSPSGDDGSSTRSSLQAPPPGLPRADPCDDRAMSDSTTGLLPALPGPRRDVDGAAGRVCLYAAGSTFAPASATPLLLVHSVNAAASAYETEPLYRHYRTERPVYALDLPGYGLSDRSARAYTPRLMTDAVLMATDAIAARHGGAAIDVIALSLSSEFVARAATERPTAFRTVALISATGLDRRAPFYGPPGSTRSKPWLRDALGGAPWSDLLFRTLTSRSVVRFFLRKTFGRPDVDDGLVDYAYRTAHRPGASNAPFDFLSGNLFSADISRVYEAVPTPVLLVHGTRGDFVTYDDAARMARVAGWTVAPMGTGALPYFEDLDGFVAIYEAFLAAHAPSGRTTASGAGPAAER